MTSRLCARRRFLLAATTPWLPHCGGTTRTREIWLSAEGSSAAEFGAAWVDASGRALSLPVGFRGHEVVQHPLRPERALVVARRPGRHMAEVDLVDQRVVRTIECAKAHEQGGHACFSADGKVVFSAESNYERGEGRIVVRDADDYRQLDEYASHGVGPHELVLLPDGKTLVVANGGLLTHPDSADEVLNLDTMRSRLSFVASTSGDLLDEYGVAESKASIRHLDVSAQGEITVAIQMQRDAVTHEELAPLAAVFDPEQGLQVLEAPETLLWQCADYMGSTRINAASGIAGYTSPRGNIALFWALETREFVGYHRFQDVCGIAVSLDESEFVLSNSSGQIRRLDAFTLAAVAEDLELPGFAWDNHLRAIELPG